MIHRAANRTTNGVADNRITEKYRQEFPNGPAVRLRLSLLRTGFKPWLGAKILQASGVAIKKRKEEKLNYSVLKSRSLSLKARYWQGMVLLRAVPDLLHSFQ